MKWNVARCLNGGTESMKLMREKANPRTIVRSKLAEDRDHWRALVIVILNLQVT